MTDSVDSSEWRVSAVYGTNLVRRWRPVVEIPALSLVLGFDDDLNWVQFVPQTGTVIPARPGGMLYYFRILDLVYEDFLQLIAERARTWSEDDLVLRGQELVSMLLADALGSESPVYVGMALRWCKSALLDERVKRALKDLVNSKRGTQMDRHTAARILRGGEAH